MTQEDIKSTLLDKYPHISEEHLNLIIKDFWSSIRGYLTDPLKSRGGIILHNLLSFDIAEGRLVKFAKLLKNPDVDHSKFKKNDIELYEQLIKQKEKYARQKSK